MPAGQDPNTEVAAVSLPQVDKDFLSERAIEHQISSEGGMTCVVLPKWQLPKGFDHEGSDLLIRLAPGYPDVHPDMWWFDPPIHLADGQKLPNTEARENHLGRQWQRWSRHFSNGQWKPGTDCLETYLTLIKQTLERSVPGSAR